MVYIEKKNRKRRLPKKAIFFFISVLVVLVVLVTGLVLFITRRSEVKDSLIEMPFDTRATYFCVKNTIVYADGDLLTCIDSSKDVKWQLKMYTSGLRYDAGNDVIIATSDTALQVIDAAGRLLFGKQLEDGVILSARAGSTAVAVLVEQETSDATLTYILVFDLSGNDIYTIPMSDYNILDYGFDAQGVQLYVLALDVDGTAPISHIYTYRPQTQTMTGINDLIDQLVGRVYISGDTIYAMGTNYLTTFKSLKQSQKRLVYGWSVADLHAGETPVFVYAPSGEIGGALSSARVISASGNEVKLNLPSGVSSVLDSGKKIYCFASDRIFVYTVEGKYQRMHPLTFEIDSVSKAVEGFAFLTSGGSVYLLPLP